jgi:hypothetical protein
VVDRAIDPLFAVRPAHGLYSGLMIWAFGDNPLPYHLAAAAALAGSVVLFWVVLRQLRLAPALAFAAAALFAVLPQLSTIRVWFAAACATWSMLFFLAGAACFLRYLDGAALRWRIGAVALWALSLAFYEVHAPLIGLLVLYAIWRRAECWRPRVLLRVAIRFAPELSLLIIATLVKAVVGNRISMIPLKPAALLFDWNYDWRVQYGLNLKALLLTNLWSPLDLGVRSAADVSASAIAASALAAVLVLARSWNQPAPRRRAAAVAGGAGVLLLFAGYGAFLLTTDLAFSPAGINNRTAVAAALGVGLIYSAIAFAVLQGRAASIALAALTFLLCLRTCAILQQWPAASAVQARFLTQAKQDLAALPPGSTVLVDRLCPYEGPAVVFETEWDMASALTRTLGRPVIANIVDSRMRFGRESATSSIYGFGFTYPYGPRTYRYDAGTRTVQPLAGPPRSSATRCPAGFPSHGVPF